jgi:hypothetical protein
MNESINFTKRCTRSTPVCLLAFLSASQVGAAEIGQRFASVEAFVHSMPQGQAEVAEGYGDLLGAGHRDWAGAVSLEDPEIGSAQRIVVLAQQPDGGYLVAAQGPTRSTDGGSRLHGLEGVQVDQGSVFVSWSWSWHGCVGGSTQQIKYYRKQWRVIGAKFTSSKSVETPNGDEIGNFARISHNLLTGDVVMNLESIGGRSKPKTLRARHAPVTILLDEGFGERSGSTDEFSSYAGC